MKFNKGQGLHDAQYHKDYDENGKLVKSHGWIQYQFPSAARVVRLKLVVRDDYGSNYPKTFTLSGSNNGSSFTTIQTFNDSNQPDDGYGEERYYDVSNNNFYTYYRITGTAFDDRFALADIQMYGYKN